MSNVPPSSPERRHRGNLGKLSPAAKAKRSAKRARKKGTEADWRARVWARRHIKSEHSQQKPAGPAGERAEPGASD